MADDFSSIKGVLKKFNPQQDRFVSREFQKYAYDLAMELNDQDHMGIYMRLAKTVPRHILERARSFVKDANAKNPARLYMWKIKQIREEIKKRDLK